MLRSVFHDHKGVKEFLQSQEDFEGEGRFVNAAQGTEGMACFEDSRQVHDGSGEHGILDLVAKCEATEPEVEIGYDLKLVWI